MDSKTFPDFNNNIKMNVDHKKKLTAGDLELRYGGDLKDKSKRVNLAGSLIRKIKSLDDMDLSYKMEAQAPELVRSFFVSL